MFATVMQPEGPMGLAFRTSREAITLDHMLLRISARPATPSLAVMYGMVGQTDKKAPLPRLVAQAL